MEVTEVKVRIVRDGGKEKLRAFASITLDNSFVVREVKVIDGDKGLFVAMPSRKVTEKCRRCNTRNVVQSKFCNGCGEKLPASRDDNSFVSGKLYMDVAHPINSECRRKIHDAVIEAFEKAVNEKKEFSERNDSERNDSTCDVKDNYENDDFDNFDEDSSFNEEKEEEEEMENAATIASDSGDAFNKGIFS